VASAGFFTFLVCKSSELTISVGTELGYDISNANINDSQESLVLLFELLLVENLNCEDAIFVGATDKCELNDLFNQGGGVRYKSKLSFQYGFRVLLLTVVVLVCSPLMVATAKGSGKPEEISIQVLGRRRSYTYEKHPSYRVHQLR